MKTVVFGGSYGERKVSKDLGGVGGFRWLTWEMEGTDLTDRDLAHFLFCFNGLHRRPSLWDLGLCFDISGVSLLHQEWSQCKLCGF